MRYKFQLTFIVLFVIMVHSYSQQARFGFFAGPVYSNNTRTNVQVISNDSSKTYTLAVYGIVNYFGGFTASIPLNKNLIFKPQVQYIKKGWLNKEYYNVNTQYTNKITANCIDVPLNFVYAVPTSSGRFLLGLGPSFSYVLSGKIHIEKDGSNHPFTYNANDSTGFSVNRFDVGTNLLAGYEFKNGIFINLNYYHGLRNFQILEENLSPVNKMISTGVCIGYMFQTKRR